MIAVVREQGWVDGRGFTEGLVLVSALLFARAFNGNIAGAFALPCRGRGAAAGAEESSGTRITGRKAAGRGRLGREAGGKVLGAPDAEIGRVEGRAAATCAGKMERDGAGRTHAAGASAAITTDGAGECARAAEGGGCVLDRGIRQLVRFRTPQKALAMRAASTARAERAFETVYALQLALCRTQLALHQLAPLSALTDAHHPSGHFRSVEPELILMHGLVSLSKLCYCYRTLTTPVYTYTIILVLHPQRIAPFMQDASADELDDELT
jgi:hypothetical protein